MATQPHRLRAEDVPNIPTDDPSSTGWELVDGELVAVVAAKAAHAWLIVEIGSRLRDHIQTTSSGGAVFADVWVLLPQRRDPDRLRGPDVAYFGAEKLARLKKGDFFRDPPDLAVEIYSPANYRKRGDFQTRVRDFVDAGTRLLWVIYPDASYAMVHRGDGSARMIREMEALDGENVLPGFQLRLGELLEVMPG